MLSELIETLEQTIQQLAGKINEACVMGDHMKVTDYAEAMREACAGYRELTGQDDE